MQKMILGTAAMLLLAAASLSVHAQNTDVKKPEKDEKTTDVFGACSNWTSKL